MSFWEEFWQNIRDTSWFEYVAVLLNLIYVVLAARQLVICWLFAFLGSCAFIVIGFNANLYVDCVLNAFYAVLAIIGWIEWQRKGSSDNKLAVRLQYWPLKYHLISWPIIAVCGLSCGYVLDQTTDQAFPYTDSLIFFVSILATWMITRKIVENWIYLAVVDFICVFIYYQRGYAMMCVLFALYTVLAIWGFFEWRRKMQNDRMQNSTLNS